LYKKNISRKEGSLRKKHFKKNTQNTLYEKGPQEKNISRKEGSSKKIHFKKKKNTQGRGLHKKINISRGENIQGTQTGERHKVENSQKRITYPKSCCVVFLLGVLFGVFATGDVFIYTAADRPQPIKLLLI
ncbi:8781_t:CDS:1, partial [Cetraspora pellucida]